MDDEDREDIMNQGMTFPLGVALRTTFSADNHDSLAPEITQLMIELSRQGYEPVTPPVPAVAAPSAPARRPGLITRMTKRLLG